MYTIKDYLKYYKDISLNDVHWNAIDNLMCAILVYLPLDSFSETKNIVEFYNYALTFKNSLTTSTMVLRSYEILEKVVKASRYKSLTITNFSNLKNSNTQFGAATFRINDLTIISYKGTDGSLIGWMENFRLGYQYPTNTHLLAIDYLNMNLSRKDKFVYVVGHSKGGNLAMVSAFETNSQNFAKIKMVYNFDGPGLKKEEFLSSQYNKLCPKLINVIPKDSVVGVILNNRNYYVITSEEKAINAHYPTNWNIFGEHFIEGKLSSISKQLHESTTIGVENLDKKKMAETLEAIFKSLEKDSSSKFKLNLKDIKNFYLNMKEVDPKVKKYLDTILDSMIKAIYTKDKDIDTDII